MAASTEARAAQFWETVFRRLALATAVATYLLVVLGGAVKAYGAGLACPDWPLCHGRAIPPLDPLVLLEWGHRLGASVVSLLSLATAAVGWRVHRTDPGLMRTLGLALVLLAAQVILGGVTVFLQNAAAATGAHLGTAMAFFATWLALSVRAAQPAPGYSLDGARRFRRLAVAALAVTWALMVLGSYLKSAGGGLACPDWPLCHGRLVPQFDHWLVALHWAHRVVALVAGGLIVATAVQAWRTQGHRPLLVAAAAAAAVLYFVQVVLGALVVWSLLAPPVTAVHLAVAAALFGCLAVVAAMALRTRELVPIMGGQEAALVAPASGAALGGGEVRAGEGAPAGAAPGVWDYIALMKPRIIVLLLVTTYAAMWVAAGGPPPLALTFWTLLGGTLAAGSANAINMFLDRDVDAVMRRTQGRPLPAGRVDPQRALVFGVVTGILAFVQMAVTVNLLAALLSLAGNLFYVFVYTAWLKRTTPQNIVIGGAAGAIPPVVGWAAVTGEMSWAAWVMFLIIFLWTPPHFWALALFRKDDYARAGIPMLPVVAGETETRRQICWYSVAMVPASLLLYWPLGVVGPLYAGVALALGAGLVYFALALLRGRMARAAHLLFSYSLAYLALLFLAMALDPRR